VLPANYTFVAADNGVHTFANVLLKIAGAQTITATDTVTSAITGSANVTVNAAAAATFDVTAPATATAGASFSVGLTARDAYSNIATGYTGTVRISTTDGQARGRPGPAGVAASSGCYSPGNPRHDRPPRHLQQGLAGALKEEV